MVAKIGGQKATGVVLVIIRRTNVSLLVLKVKRMGPLSLNKVTPFVLRTI